MAGPFALDGYDVLAPLGSTERSWRARSLADGAAVVLRRWAGAANRSAEARRRAALWGSLPGQGVVPVRDVVVIGDDLVVVSDLAHGGGLDALLGRRAGLRPGQIVTLVAPLADALAEAHERGLVHGRISPGNVVLDADGRPLLTDWMLSREGDPAADVTALTELASGCLSGDAPEIEAALRAPVDARALSRDLLAAVLAEPLTAAPSPVVDDTEIRDGGAREARGVFGAIAVAGLAVAIAVGVGVLWGGHDQAARGATLPQPVRTAHATVSVSPTSVPTPRVDVDWRAVVQALERRRMHALAEGDVASLAQAEVRGTSLWRHDVRVVAQLRATHAHLRGLHVEVRSVQVLTVQSERAVVRVEDAFSSYGVVTMRLRRVDNAWLIAGVSRRSR